MMTKRMQYWWRLVKRWFRHDPPYLLTLAERVGDGLTSVSLSHQYTAAVKFAEQSWRDYPGLTNSTQVVIVPLEVEDPAPYFILPDSILPEMGISQLVFYPVTITVSDVEKRAENSFYRVVLLVDVWRAYDPLGDVLYVLHKQGIVVARRTKFRVG